MLGVPSRVPAAMVFAWPAPQICMVMLAIANSRGTAPIDLPIKFSARTVISKGTKTMTGYYNSQHLADFGKIADVKPEIGKKFFEYYGAVFEDGALTAREKSLIALAVAHAVQCPYCIDAYTQDCQQKGADMEQMIEALHVAVAIRGGASLVHGMQMREIANKQGM
jgi:alkylhydroperoxidase/carboxymuconolactone decarboxylase family protein